MYRSTSSRFGPSRLQNGTFEPVSQRFLGRFPFPVQSYTSLVMLPTGLSLTQERLTNIPMQVGATVQTCAYSKAQLLVARFVTGIGTGIMSSAVPVYQSELCDARKRGMYVCSQPLAIGVGIVVSYWFDYGMSFVEGPVNWRLPIACQLVFVVLVILMVFG